MKKLPYRSFLPKLFIALGLLFWIKTGITQYWKRVNDEEIQNKWAAIFQQKSKRIAVQNIKERKITAFQIILRPDDKPILDGIDSILALQNKTILRLAKEQAKDKIDVAAIESLLKELNSGAGKILSGLAKKNPIIRQEEIDNLTASTLLHDLESLAIENKPYLFGRLAYYVYQSAAIFNRYLWRKVGGVIGCCWGRGMELRFLHPLKVGKASEGLLFWEDGCSQVGKAQYAKEMIINDKPYLAKYGVAQLNTVFQDTLPKRFEVKTEWYKYVLVGEEIRKDTIVESSVFTVYPLKEKD